MSFEKLEPSLEIKRLINKYKDDPKPPYMKDIAVHWTKVLLPGDREFFFEMAKMKDEARNKLFQEKPEAADRYHELWEKLRANGWRRLQDRDGIWHWYCMFEHLIQKITKREAPTGPREPTQAEIDGWEREIDEQKGWEK